MNAFEVTSDERVLFVLTHPDDELAIIAFLRRLAGAGVPVHVCWIHSNFVREQESRAVMDSVGVAPERLTFLVGPDGRIAESLLELMGPMKALIGDFDPTRVYVNAFEQGHIDHDATNLLVSLCFSGPVFEVPLYHTYLRKVPVLNRFSSDERVEVMSLTREESALKRRLIKMFPSQTVRRNMTLYALLSLARLRVPELYGTERARLQTHKDFLSPNHPEPISSAVAASATWKRWVGVVKPLVTSRSSD